jgi:hypothetical protein
MAALPTPQKSTTATAAMTMIGWVAGLFGVSMR